MNHAAKRIETGTNGEPQIDRNTAATAKISALVARSGQRCARAPTNAIPSSIPTTKSISRLGGNTYQRQSATPACCGHSISDVANHTTNAANRTARGGAPRKSRSSANASSGKSA